MLAIVTTAIFAFVAQEAPRDVGLIEMHGDHVVARLSVRSDQLDPYCHAGLDGDVLSIPSAVVRSATGWSVDAAVHVFVGSRRVGSARVVDIDLGQGCWVEATLAMDGPLPWTLPSDVLWATVRNRPSTPPVPVGRLLVRAAEREAKRDIKTTLGESNGRDCLASLRATAGGFRAGAVVGFSCDSESGAFGRIYLVRKDQSVVGLRLPGTQPDDVVSLLEVITPGGGKNLDLVISAETSRGRERRWVRVPVPEPKSPTTPLPPKAPGPPRT